jgi:lysophospholipase L1-like esterase
MLAFTFVAALAAPVLAVAAPTPPIYLSLGTSLSVGIQPDSTGQNQVTNEGYADQLHRILKLRSPRLQLMKLGCPSETSASMITGAGSICRYPAGSQLAQAVAFLAANHGAVSLITIDVGANDLLSCAPGGIIDPVCVGNAFAAVQTNLPYIMTTLKSVAPGIPIIAMNYYNPLVALWVLVPGGEAVALQSSAVMTQFNNMLEAIYGAFAVPVADVERAFHSADFRTVPVLDVPISVVFACQWTWMCAPPPRGPNVHANHVGYFVIALQLAEKLR